jgi:hypothetical protein
VAPQNQPTNHHGVYGEGRPPRVSGVVAGLILLLGLLYGFAASFLGPLAAVFLGYLNAQTSAAAAGYTPEAASRDGKQDGIEQGDGQLIDASRHT